ncbi:hypothetical protein [Turneriella parva]|uniref:hypothetical protein n=1 Tax=Turneriella parva TaxID=29510 RepID=UPI00031B499F|nr:hypothetical protein [Turneriella parva]
MKKLFFSLALCAPTATVFGNTWAGAATDAVVNEKGDKSIGRPGYFSFYLGGRAAMPLVSDPTSYAAAESFANTHILRTQEIIYKGTGPGFENTSSSFLTMPTIRAEWEIPFERIRFLPKSPSLSALFSLEGAMSLRSQVLDAAGNFRYQNAQAQHVALTDVTYSGSLSVRERHQYIAPMVGLGTELGNPQGWRFIGSLSLGVALQNGQRDYELNLAPQQISAGAFTDTYTITASATESYAMAFLLAGRAELGVRMRLTAKLHMALVASCAVHYGVINYSGTGIFAERAGAAADKNIYQKVVSTTSDEVYLGLAPGVFLALSHEL